MFGRAIKAESGVVRRATLGVVSMEFDLTLTEERRDWVRSQKRVHGCDLDDALHGARELRVTGDERVTVQFGEGDVLRLVGTGPSELVCHLPGGASQA